MTCNNCGKKIANGAEYCPYCGAEQYEYVKKDSSHSPAGIILVAAFTVAAFLLIVYLSKTNIIEAIDSKLNQPKQQVSEDTQEEAASGEADPMTGYYTATSAVYNGVKLNSLMLKMSGYSISFDVRADGTFSATLNDDTYEGSWYRDGSYVEFYSGELSMTGEYADGVISISDDDQGMSVVLEK